MATYEGSPVANSKQVYYTGKTINATKASRTAIAEDILPTYVVAYDPYGHDKGMGVDVTQPLTANLDYFAGVVQSVPKGNERGGWINIENGFGTVVKARTHANHSASPGTRIVLGLANGDWGFVANAGSVASAALAISASLQSCALALEAADTSSTAAVKSVMLLRPGI